MSLELSRCKNCREKTMRSNPKAYCLSCRMEVKKNIESQKKSDKYINQNAGTGLYKEHYSGLIQIERDIIERDTLLQLNESSI